jgi:hypothetical protein
MTDDPFDLEDSVPIREGMVGDKSWQEYRRLILFELKRQHNKQEALDTAVQAINQSLTVLKTKAAMWGALAGLLVGTVVTIVGGLVIHTLTTH